MAAQPLKQVGVGIGTFVVLAAIWLLCRPSPSVADRAQPPMVACNGETGRFQMITESSKRLYVMDTCTGDVWAHLPSPDQAEPGAWLIMDRYDTSAEVTRLLDYLRGQPTYQDPNQADTAQAPAAYPTADTQGQDAAPQYQATDQAYQEPAQNYPQTDQQYQDPQDQPVDSEETYQQPATGGGY